MLSQVVPLLQPTREMIHQAWCMGLEYNIGTSAMGLNTLTIVAELCGRQPGDWFTVAPTDDFTNYMQEADEIADMQAQHEAEAGNRGADRPFKPLDPNVRRLPELRRVFEKSTDFMTEAQIRTKKSQLEAKRNTRTEYNYVCSRSELQNMLMSDAEHVIDEALRTAGVKVLGVQPRSEEEAESAEELQREGPRNEGRGCVEGPPGVEVDDDAFSDVGGEELGARMYERGEDPSGLSPSDPVLLGFHRARAHDFPGVHHCQLVHNATAAHQRMCPYCCTTLAETEAAFANENGMVADTRTHLSLACSHMWPDVLESCMFYKPQTLVQFAGGRPAFIDPAGSVALGTKACGPFAYKQKSMLSGASRVDIGWLQGKADHFKTWHKTAEYIRNRSSRTVMEFDFHVDGLRDCLYLCSTRDNARRCPEEPRLPNQARPERAFKDVSGNVLKEHTVCVQVSDYRHPRQQGSGFLPKDHMALPRHPASAVPDSALQRRLDSLLLGGRLSALNVLVSNKVVSTPPIRMHTEGIEVNVGAIHNHVALVAESICACALVPGLRNMQEVFCNGATGPEGLSAPPTEDAPAVGSKRTAQDAHKANTIHTLPYSYDVVGLAIALDTGSMLYDDLGAQWADTTTLKFREAYGVDIGFGDLPHLSLRYIGYAEHNRQTISIKLDSKPREGQEYEEAGDPSQSQALITKAHVERSLGRKATQDDIVKYISRRQGARSMGGVTGDLFASSTWLKHTLLSLRERGLVCGGCKEAPARAYADMEQCIQARVVEHASVAEDDRYEGFAMFVPEPGTYEAMDLKQPEDVLFEEPPPQMARQVTELSYDVTCADFLAIDAPRSTSRHARDVLHIGPRPR